MTLLFLKPKRKKEKSKQGFQSTDNFFFRSCLGKIIKYDK